MRGIRDLADKKGVLVVVTVACAGVVTANLAIRPAAGIGLPRDCITL